MDRRLREAGSSRHGVLIKRERSGANSLGACQPRTWGKASATETSRSNGQPHQPHPARAQHCLSLQSTPNARIATPPPPLQTRQGAPVRHCRHRPRQQRCQPRGVPSPPPAPSPSCAPPAAAQPLAPDARGESPGAPSSSDRAVAAAAPRGARCARSARPPRASAAACMPTCAAKSSSRSDGRRGGYDGLPPPATDAQAAQERACARPPARPQRARGRSFGPVEHFCHPAWRRACPEPPQRRWSPPSPSAPPHRTAPRRGRGSQAGVGNGRRPAPTAWRRHGDAAVRRGGPPPRGR